MPGPSVRYFLGPGPTVYRYLARPREGLWAEVWDRRTCAWVRSETLERHVFLRSDPELREVSEDAAVSAIGTAYVST
jgi:hypothetical protein